MFSKFSVQKPYTVWVGIILVIVLGVISFMNMTTDLLPSMNLPYIIVYTTYPGATPEEVEKTVTKPLEASLATASNVKKIISSSKENLSNITVEFTDGANMDSAMIELTGKIDLAGSDWPDAVGQPVMIKINPDMLPVVVAAVAYEGKNIVELSDYVDASLKPALEAVDGVAQVSASGLVSEEIRVAIDQKRIDRLNHIILKELDEELAQVEDALNAGEEKLLDAKRQLNKKGRAGLNKISDGLEQIQDSKALIAGGIEKLNGQRAQLSAQLSEAEAGRDKLSAEIEKLTSAKQALELLRAQLSAMEKQKSEAKDELDEVEEALRALPPEEAPAAETPIGETPIGETPTDETPADETPIGETPTDETPADETPADETPTGETPTGETPADETPADETPADETPTDETPTDETPADETPTDETPTDETPTDETPTDEVPKEAPPTDETPKEEAPAEEVPSGKAPEQSVPEEPVPEEPVPEEPVPEEPVPDQPAPEEPVPEEPVPEEPTPDQPAPEAEKTLSLLPAASAEGESREELLRRKAELEGVIARLSAEIDKLLGSELYATLVASEPYFSQIPVLEGKLREAQSGISEIQGGIAQMDAMLDKLKNNIIPAGFMEGVNEDTDLAAAEQQLLDARKTAKKALSKAEREIEKAQTELGEKRKEFEEKREDAFEEAKLDGVITVQMVAQLIAAQNLDMPAGYLTEDGRDYLVRVGREFDSADEMSNQVLFTMELEALDEVRLRDVAEVTLENDAGEVYAKVNKSDGVVLSLQKQSTDSTAEVADSVLEAFDRLQKETPGLRITTLMNQGIYIDMIVDSVLENLIWGGALAILILLLFLGDFRPTFIVALSIPTSVVVAFVTMYFTGITLNVMSLAGLALGVGMLVDNSIVVIENIYRLRSEGRPLLNACVEGAKQMSGAIFSSTLTTICVFLPLVFVEGIARQLFSDMGLTIAYSLLASLVVALTVVPALSSGLLRRQKERKHRLFTATQRAYVSLLRFTLRFKAPVLILTLALLIYSVSAVVGLGTSFMPDVDSAQMTASVTVPVDYTFDQTTALLNRVLDKVLTLPELDTVGVFSQKNAAMTMISGGSADSVTYYLSLRADKGRRNDAIAKDLMQMAEDMGVEMSVRINNMDISMLSGSGISVLVRGPDIQTLRRIATELAGIAEGVEGTAEVSDGQEKTVPEIRLTVDKLAAVENNLTVAQIYQYVAGLVSDGAKVATITMDDKDYPVVTLDGDNLKIRREDLYDQEIDATKGDEKIKVRLGDVCVVEEAESLSAISRDSQQRSLTVSMEVDAEHNIGTVSRELNEKLKGYQLPQGYSIELSGEGETISSTIGDMISMVLLAIVFIYLIMVAQFQSFLMPFIVLFTIPLAFTGGFLALILAGMDLSVVSLLGFLVLSGVVVNNGIVFVDSVNQLRLEGTDKRSALIETGRIRLRPILMTALTTILGMSTMAAGSGMGAEMMQPMAVVTIGGLSYATFMTLFVVPALYDMLTGRRALKKRDTELTEAGTDC